jgi:hypothetical protein
MRPRWIAEWIRLRRIEWIRIQRLRTHIPLVGDIVFVFVFAVLFGAVESTG